MVIDDPLDFEGEDDPLLAAPRPTKRKKIIGLDDLLIDYCATGKDGLKASAAKSKGHPKGYNSDDEDKQVTEKEINFCKFVDECEEKAKALDPGEDAPLWGQQVFGCQKSPSILNGTGVENCQLLQSFCGDEHLGFDLVIERGEFVSCHHFCSHDNIKMHPIFSTSEAEDLLVIVISLFLDRQLEGLLLILGDCLNSLVLYFNPSEWESSCLMVTESISMRVRMDLNYSQHCFWTRPLVAHGIRWAMRRHALLLCYYIIASPTAAAPPGYVYVTRAAFSLQAVTTSVQFLR
uniref:Uncharacterized protein n=1 Tax=Avena sativa TaxID=4498 RepID=A0ACD5VHG5_AVESA